MIKRNRSIEEKLFAYILRLQIKSQIGSKNLTDTGWDRYIEKEIINKIERITGKTLKNFIKSDKIIPEIHTMNIIANIFLKNERFPFKDFKGFSDFLKTSNISDQDKLNEILNINISKVQQTGQNPLLKLKNNFNYHFKKWQLSDSYRMTEPEYTNLLEYILPCKDLTNEMKAFSLIQALYYGNNSCHAQIENNYNNENAIEKLILLTSGNGIRVGYRAEFVLSKLDKAEVINVFKQIQKKTTDSLFKELFKEPLTRLQEGSLIDFLLSEISNMSKDNDYKRKVKEVLGWINKGTIVNQ